MTCSKQFSITVDEVTECCLVQQPSIVTASPTFYVAYDTLNDRIVSSRATDLIVVNPNTDTITNTVASGGNLSSGMVFAPVNGRIYVGLNQTSISIFNAATPAFEGSIALPGTVAFLFGYPSYDTTNDLIYWPCLTPANDPALIVVDPVGATASLLVEELTPVGESYLFGLRAAHSPGNNRIYMPFMHTDGAAVNHLYIRVYNTAGVMQTDISFGVVTTFGGGVESMFYSPANALLYWASQVGLADAPGLIVINPADNSTVTTVAYGADVPGWVCFTPACSSANVIDVVGDFTQFNTTTHAEICSTALGMFVATQMEATTAGKVYVAHGTSNELIVLEPPP